MDMEERNRAEYAQELDGTAERLRMANRGRESGLYGAEKRNSVQIALGLSMAKNTATELKKQEAVADVLAKTLTGVVLSPISSIADIMAVVNRILPMVCTLPGGKTFSAVISEGFEFVADGSVAGHVDLLGRVADAMEQVPVSAIDMKVINKLQEADRPLAIKQRKAHLAIQMDTTFVSIDVIVYKALISTLDQTMQKTVATTTSTIEMLAAIWIFKNYGWYTRSKEAVKGLTKPHVFDVNPQTSFDTVVDELIQDIRSRLEPVQKTGLSTLGMAVMMSLESLPRNKDPLQAQMLTEVEVAARSTTHQSDLTFQEVEEIIRNAVKRFQPVSGAPGDYTVPQPEKMLQTYIAAGDSDHAGGHSKSTLAKRVLHNPAAKKSAVRAGAPRDNEGVQYDQERRQPEVPPSNQQRPGQEEPARRWRQGQQPNQGGGLRDGWYRRPDDVREEDRGGRGKSPQRNRDREWRQRDNSCYAGANCERILDGTCRYEHTPEQIDAAHANRAGGDGGRGSSRQRPERDEDTRHEAPEQRLYGSYMAKAVQHGGTPAHQTKVFRGPVKAATREGYDRVGACVGLTATEVAKTCHTDGNALRFCTAEQLQQDLKDGLLVMRTVQRRHSAPLVWSPKVEIETFNESKSTDTVNDRIQIAFEAYESKRIQERTLVIPSLPRKSIAMRQPPTKPELKKSNLSVKADAFQPEGASASARASVDSTTGVRQKTMSTEEPVTTKDGTWTAKRQLLLQQDRDQTPAQKRAFKEAHQGQTVRSLVSIMDTLIGHDPTNANRHIVQFPLCVSRSQMQILSATSVEGKWKVLVDTCAELTLFGEDVPHVETGASNVSLLGVGGTVVNAEHEGSFVIVRRTDKKVIQIVHGHMVKTIPKRTVLLGWYPLVEEHPRANLVLRKNNEVLWMEEPNAERRTGWGLGPMHSKLVEITDAYDIYPSLEAAKAAAEAASVNMVADTFTGVIDSERHHIPRVTTTTVDQLPALPTAPGNAYAAWILDKPVVESTREAPIAECPPPSVVNAASWSSNGRVQQVAADRRAANVSAKAASKEHEAKRRVQGRVFVNHHDVCAAEMSVPIAQQAAVPADKKKVETKVEAMNENKKTKTDEKEIMPQAAIEAPAQHTQVTIEKTKIVEASADEQVLDEQLMKGTLVYCIRRAAVPYCKQVSDRKLIDWPIEKLYKVVMKDQEVMKNVLMQWCTQPAAQARALVTEAKLNELPINEILKLVVAVRSFQRKRQQALVIRRQDGTSVFIDRAGRMSVIDRIAYATRLKAGRALIGAAVPIEKKMEDEVSETRVKRQRREAESDNEVEDNIEKECATELSDHGTQCAQGSPSNLMRQQFVQMNENEMDVERLTSNRHEDQRIEIGSQRGGALQSECRRRPRALSHSDEETRCESEK